MKTIALTTMAVLLSALACFGQRKLLPNVTTSAQSVQQAPDIRPGHVFSDLQIVNATNGDIPYIVQYLQSKTQYKGAVIAGQTALLNPDDDCIFIVPDGSFQLSKNCHYYLSLDANKKVILKRIL